MASAWRGRAHGEGPEADALRIGYSGPYSWHNSCNVLRLHAIMQYRVVRLVRLREIDAFSI